MGTLSALQLVSEGSSATRPLFHDLARKAVERHCIDSIECQRDEPLSKCMFFAYFSDVIISTMAPQIASVSIVYSTDCSGQKNENIKAPRHGPFWGEFTGARWIPRTKGQ